MVEVRCAVDGRKLIMTFEVDDGVVRLSQPRGTNGDTWLDVEGSNATPEFPLSDLREQTIYPLCPSHGREAVRGELVIEGLKKPAGDRSAKVLKLRAEREHPPRP